MAGRSFRVTFIPGDGIGPEISEATRRVLEAAAERGGFRFEWDVQHAGAEVGERTGHVLPQAVLDSVRRHKVAIKGPLTTPIGKGFRSVNVALRQELDLYACLRPCKTFEGAPSRFPGFDITIVRENTEDLYAGIEYQQGSADARRLISFLGELGANVRPDAGISIKPISIFGSERIVRFAFEYARAHGRRKVTAVTKANIMKFSDGLFLEVAQRVAQEYPDIAYDEQIVDIMTQHLVKRPHDFDVLVLPNLYGDILSDLCAGIIGGVGLAPGGNFGTEAAVFEPTHGSAPRYGGQNKVNPMAQMLSGAMMLRHLGEADAAHRVEAAIATVVREGKSVTYDLKADRSDPTAVGTSQVADAVIEKL